MAGRLAFGVESEYAASFRYRGQGGPAPDALAHGLEAVLGEVARAGPSLRAHPGGVFVASGARIYIDAGLHMEAATPECSHPDQLVAHLCGCDRMLLEAARRILQKGKFEDAAFEKRNVDNLSRTTWGFHENYQLANSQSEDLARFMVPFLATRLIYSGGGGFYQPRFPELQFTLSPRTWFLTNIVSDSSQSARGIFHVKGEPLANSGDRLHILCGENACSHRALAVRIAATALVAACLDHERTPGNDVLLAHPLGAMQAFASDPGLEHRAPLVSGGAATAIEIQRRFLSFVESHAGSPFLPDWTGEMLAAWKGTLDALESGSAPTFLDWAIKHALYSNLLAKRGFSWKSFAAAGRSVATRIELWQKEHPPARRDRRAAAPTLSNIVAEFLKSGAAARDNGCHPEDYFAVHARLLELDSLFGRLGDGLFAELDRAGVLDHRLPSVTEASIRNATRRPPRGTRAWPRGAAIRLLASKRRRDSWCDWSRVTDMKAKRFLELDDVFAGRPEWTEFSADPSGIDAAFGLDDLPLYPRPTAAERALEFYDRGQYEAAHQALLDAERRYPHRVALGREYHSIRVWVNARRGDVEATFRALAALPERPPDDLSYICDFVCAHRYLGLVPHDGIRSWIDSGLEVLRAAPESFPGAASTFLGHVAYWNSKCGRPEDAMGHLEKAFLFNRINHAHPHTVSRIYAERGEVHRQRGDVERARFDLAQARRIQTEHNFEGDLADFTLTGLARAESDPEEALRLLRQACEIQTRLENEMGECRTQLLLARVDKESSGPQYLARVRAIAERRLALRPCPLFRKIMAHWEEWVSGAPDPDNGPDPFWFL